MQRFVIIGITVRGSYKLTAKYRKHSFQALFFSAQVSKIKAISHFKA